MGLTRRVAGVSLVLVATLISPTLAHGDAKPNSSDNLVYKDEIEKYKIDFALYRQQLRKYEEARRQINAKFKAAIERAMSDNKPAELLAASQAQKRQHSASKRGAVALATSQRDAAMANLGVGPTPPPEPMKPWNPQKDRRDARTRR
jgi:hypothetical protein